ncbi:MAG: polysaccharide biosynthesis protein [Hominilimicola sp.]
MNCVLPFIRGRVCMVTGGGGSIGSELVRQLARLDAAKIVIVDIYENGAYDVKCEVGDTVTVEIASVRDYDKMDYIMSQYKPHFVFHAAAHKHVPFMEQNPEEAVKNNIRGTEIMAQLAEKYSADNFVLISTDKAVEPISVMGASKRICEMLVYEMSQSAKLTKFTAVRFGNVIGSNGSVIPLFKKQLERGIVTVTHMEVTRYFMTISQAVELVLKSLAVAQGGELFVLDMGERVKILDVAEKVIRDAGKEPYKDVKIEFTGLRQGDKLHEKLFYDFEAPKKTQYDKILCVQGSSIEGLTPKTEKLYKLAAENDRAGIIKLMMKITDKDLIRRI